jgi:hypothetical protein
MRQLTFWRNGVESLPARLRPADEPKAKSRRRLFRHDAYHRDETEAM